MNGIDGTWYLHRHSLLEPILKEKVTKLNIAKQDETTLTASFDRKDGKDDVTFTKQSGDGYFLGQGKSWYRIELMQIGGLEFLLGYAKKAKKSDTPRDLFIGLREGIAKPLPQQPQGTFPWNRFPLYHQQGKPHTKEHELIVEEDKITVISDGKPYVLAGSFKEEDDGWTLKAESKDKKKEFSCWFFRAETDGEAFTLLTGYFYVHSYHFQPADEWFNSSGSDQCTGGSGGGRKI